MRRMGIAGVCLLALLVAGLAIASGASAEPPEFKVCAKTVKVEKKYTGKWKDKTCGTEPEPKGEGKYERVSWEKAKKKKFKGKGAKSLFLIINPTDEEGKEPTGKVESNLECQSEKTEGEVTGPNTATWSTVYKKCEVHALKNEIVGPCETEGAHSGEIKTGPMEGKLVYLNAAKTTVGLRQAPVPGPSYAKISCIEGLVNDTPSGEALLEVTGNTNLANKTTGLVAKEGPHHGQDPYYEEEAHSEAEAFSAIDFSGCVAEEMKKGLTEEEAQFACILR